MAIDLKKVEEDLKFRYGAFSNSFDMTRAKKLYDKLKEATTDTYYVRSNYGEDEFYKDRGENVRHYILPVSILGSEDGKSRSLSGSYHMGVETLSALDYMAKQENWSITGGNKGFGENDPIVEYISITANKEVLEKFVEEKKEQQRKENAIIQELDNAGIDITKLSREQLDKMKAILTGQKSDEIEPISEPVSVRPKF